MNKDGFKQRVERSSLGSRHVTAARVLASKSTARKVLAQAQSSSRSTKGGSPKKSL